jgi:hypothetical protein
VLRLVIRPTPLQVRSGAKRAVRKTVSHSHTHVSRLRLLMRVWTAPAAMLLLETGNAIIFEALKERFSRCARTHTQTHRHTYIHT